MHLDKMFFNKRIANCKGYIAIYILRIIFLLIPSKSSFKNTNHVKKWKFQASVQHLQTSCEKNIYKN